MPGLTLGFVMTAKLDLAPEQLTRPRGGLSSDLWRSFRRHKLAVISLVVLLIICFVAVFAAQVMPYDPNATNTSYAIGKPQPPSALYALGTDNYGRDYLSRTISSLQIS